MIEKQITSRKCKAGALILMDLDHFKTVNDTLGHQAGDKLLIDTANVLKKNFHSGDIACRLGGDELYQHADEALYVAKEHGRNGYAFYSDC